MFVSTILTRTEMIQAPRECKTHTTGKCPQNLAHALWEGDGIVPASSSYKKHGGVIICAILQQNAAWKLTLQCRTRTKGEGIPGNVPKTHGREMAPAMQSMHEVKILPSMQNMHGGDFILAIQCTHGGRIVPAIQNTHGWEMIPATLNTRGGEIPWPM